MMMTVFHRLIKLISAFTLLLPTSLYAQALSPESSDYETPLTPWGHPDIQGVWDRRTITPLQRPERFADTPFLNEAQVAQYEALSAQRSDGRPIDFGRSGISVHDPGDLDYGSTVLATGQTSLVVDPPNGIIPSYVEMADTRLAIEQRENEGRGAADSWLDRSLQERCITWGIPQGMLPQAYNNNIQIVQSENHVAIVVEMVHDARIIPLHNLSPLPETITQWHGSPRGHWEGNTLVVESTNFSSKSNFRRANINLKLIERFTRVSDNFLMYEFTVEDDTTWTRPWTVSFPMVSSDLKVYEFACHEGNYGLQNILRAARAEDARNLEGALVDKEN